MHRAEAPKVKAVVDRALDGRPSLRVLEAGCGSAGHVDWGDRAHLVGIDISEKQLERNHDVDEKIVGDIQNYAFPGESFDAIVCWDVLEHLDRPDLALENFTRALKSDGIIVLGIPNARSLKGVLTKYTPFGFHVWVYRRLLGKREKTGREDVGPFPTYMRPAMAPAAIRTFAERRGLATLYFSSFESSVQRRLRHRLLLRGWAWSAFKSLVRYLSLGRLDAENSDCIFVLARNPVGSERGRGDEVLAAQPS